MFAVYILLASLAAITSLAAANAALGGWTRTRINSLESAVAELAADLVTFESDDGVVAPDGRAALAAERGGARIGLVVTQGDRYVTRLIAPGELAKATVTPSGDLVITARDITLPRVTIALKNAQTAQSWASRLIGAPPPTNTTPIETTPTGELGAQANG